MPEPEQLNSRVERALVESKRRIPGMDFEMERSETGLPRFTILFDVPSENQNDDLPDLSRRFEDETAAVADIMEVHGLPRFDQGYHYDNEVVDSDGEVFYSEFELRDAYDGINETLFNLDPEPGMMDGLVTTRSAGDFTPSTNSIDDARDALEDSLDQAREYAASQEDPATILTTDAGTPEPAYAPADMQADNEQTERELASYSGLDSTPAMAEVKPEVDYDDYMDAKRRIRELEAQLAQANTSLDSAHQAGCGCADCQMHETARMYKESRPKVNAPVMNRLMEYRGAPLTPTYLPRGGRGRMH